MIGVYCGEHPTKLDPTCEVCVQTLPTCPNPACEGPVALRLDYPGSPLISMFRVSRIRSLPSLQLDCGDCGMTFGEAREATIGLLVTNWNRPAA